MFFSCKEIFKSLKVQDKVCKVIIFILCINIAVMLLDSAEVIPSHKIVKYETTEKIYSLLTEPGTNGRFCLGTGTANSHLTYYYYVEGKDNSKVAKSIDAEKTNVKMTNDYEPQVIKHFYYRDYPLSWESIMCWPLPTGSKRQVHDEYQSDILIVPENTIHQTYKIN